MEPGRRPQKLAALVCVWLAWYAAGQPSSAPDDQATSQRAAAPVLVAPTQGRPAFVEPGGVFRVVAQFSQPTGRLRFELVSRDNPGHRHLLVSQAAGGESTGAAFDLTVPEEVPEQTYDLETRGGADVLVGRHAVAVARVGRRVRVVHLSNMNVGEPGVPDFDQRLITEVNLIAPTLIIATGDFLDATHDAPESGWRRLSEFLGRFDAPTLVACGDHDDVALYSRFMAPSPIGAIDMGPYRGLVLYDVPAHPITADSEQTLWVERALGRAGHRLSFVVAHDDCPNLLRHWQDQGSLERIVRGGRLGLWFAGGQRDWDGREYRGIVDAAAPLLYLRTHQSSPATRDGAEGVSHYRVVDLDGERAIHYGPWTAAGLPASIAVGRLNVVFDEPNDGRQRRVALTAVSGLPFRVNSLATRVLVQRSGGARPWCHGARLERVVDLGDLWECRLGFDLPDKGALRAVVGTGPEPKEPEVEVRFDGPRQLVFKTAASEDGLTYLTADWSGTVQLENCGAQTAEVSPLVRLDGGPVAYRVIEETGPFATAYRLRLEPRQVVTLQLDLSASRITPGRRELQVYVKGGSAWGPTCWPLDVTMMR